MYHPIQCSVVYVVDCFDGERLCFLRVSLSAPRRYEESLAGIRLLKPNLITKEKAERTLSETTIISSHVRPDMMWPIHSRSP